jgi:hypothetical protein
MAGYTGGRLPLQWPLPAGAFGSAFISRDEREPPRMILDIEI